MNRVNESTRDFFFVGKGDQNLKTSGNLKTTGNTVNIADGQLGVVSASHGLSAINYMDFLGSSNVTNSPEIQIVQGTPAATNNAASSGFFYEDNGYLISPVLKKDNILSFSARIAPLQLNSSVLFTGFEAPVADREYSFYIKLRSERKDRDYGRNTDDMVASFSKSSYAGITDSTGYLLQQLAYRVLNRSVLSGTQPSWSPVSKTKQVVPFLINAAGATGGVALGTLVLNDAVPIATLQNQIIYYTVDEAFLQTVHEWISNSTVITADSTIMPIDLSVAGAAPKATGTVTILDNTAIAGDAVTVGTDTFTEGTDWDAGANAAASAVALAAAINATSTVATAQAVGDTVVITAVTAGEDGNDIVFTVTDANSDDSIEATGSGTLGGGSDAGADAIVFMGLDHELAAAYDDIPHVKVKVEVEAGQYFTESVLTKEVLAKPVEDNGSGRNFKIWYDRAAFAQTGSQQLTGFADDLLLAPNYIDQTKKYTAYIIDTQDVQNTLTVDVRHQKRIIILLPSALADNTVDAETGFTMETSDSTTVTDLENVLGAWLKAANSHPVLGDATPSTYFV